MKFIFLTPVVSTLGFLPSAGDFVILLNAGMSIPQAISSIRKYELMLCVICSVSTTHSVAQVRMEFGTAALCSQQ